MLPEDLTAKLKKRRDVVDAHEKSEMQAKSSLESNGQEATQQSTTAHESDVQEQVEQSVGTVSEIRARKDQEAKAKLKAEIKRRKISRRIRESEEIPIEGSELYKDVIQLFYEDREKQLAVDEAKIVEEFIETSRQQGEKK